MAAESGGGALWGLLQVTGPENLAHQGIQQILARQGGQKNIREKIARSAVGQAALAEEIATKTWQKQVSTWLTTGILARKVGLPLPESVIPPRPTPLTTLLQYASAPAPLFGGSGISYATQPTQPTPPPPQQPTDWLDAITRGLSRGLELRDLVLRLMRLIGSPSGSGAGGDFFRTTYTTTTTGPTGPIAGGGGQMPYLMAPTGGALSSMFSGGDLVRSLPSIVTGISGIISAMRGASNVMPGGMAFGGPDFSNVQSGSASCPAMGLWRTGAGTTARPIPRIIQQNPVSGQLQVWEYAGHPIAFSRDKIVAKRWNKLTGGRRRFR